MNNDDINDLDLTRSNGLLITHSCCVTGYYSPDNEEEVIRATAIIVDLLTDKIVDRIESTQEEAERDGVDAFSDRIILLAKKYNAVIINISEPIPLEKCECCGENEDRILDNEEMNEIKRVKGWDITIPLLISEN